MNTILKKILTQRKTRIRNEGFSQNLTFPENRVTPLVPFPLVDSSGGSFICEIKRRSPSRGVFEDTKSLGAVEFADVYNKNGIQNISVLTEQDNFGGSLQDLVDVKKKYPHTAVLRKDFLLYKEDIEVSYKAGADAVLLMASVLDNKTLHSLFDEVQKHGLVALVEVHTKEEVQRVFSTLNYQNKHFVIGINCRNLHSFVLDKLLPLEITRYIQKKFPNFTGPCVFESAIFNTSDIAFVHISNCRALLVGEAAVRFSHRIPEWQKTFKEVASSKKQILQNKTKKFWEDVIDMKKGNTTLIKICGLCNKEDVKVSIDCGADFLGFILVQTSPRKTNIKFLQELAESNINFSNVKKIAVIIGPPTPDMEELITKGFIDAFQIHKLPQDVNIDFPWYRAEQVGKTTSTNSLREGGSPRTLVDFYSPVTEGGTGHVIEDVIVKKVSKEIPLWLAGGLSPLNITEKIITHRPELVDLASGVEKQYGVKDHTLLKKFCSAVKNTKH